MDVRTFVRSRSGFSSKNHPNRIKAFGWFLHVHALRERFSAADILDCYSKADLDPPANMRRFLDSLTEKSPPELIRDANGFRLAHDVRIRMDEVFGEVGQVLAIERMLADLPGKLSDEGERLFLTETLTCYRHGAHRAAIVMAWNLAYDHLLRWILADPVRVAGFNAGIARRNRAKANVSVSRREDFEDLKEDEVIDIVGNVAGLSGGTKKLLKEKLGRRNTYAHPSTLHVERAQVDDMITDLTNNVVVALKL